MAGNPDDWPEIISPDAFDGQLPRTVPVRGPDGEIIEGATAEVSKDGTGLLATITMPGGEKTTGRLAAGDAPPFSFSIPPSPPPGDGWHGFTGD